MLESQSKLTRQDTAVQGVRLQSWQERKQNRNTWKVVLSWSEHWTMLADRETQSWVPLTCRGKTPWRSSYTLQMRFVTPRFSFWKRASRGTWESIRPLPTFHLVVTCRRNYVCVATGPLDRLETYSTRMGICLLYMVPSCLVVYCEKSNHLNVYVKSNIFQPTVVLFRGLSCFLFIHLFIF